ncbi:hypothetical protein L6452_31356 [Arctium lappa]|uniref:Uncharacterized protein n=1 Tax=Arctium lappa TaxID=4217 RepID=A0ACB8ZKY3_ARCLA|nr:hypothetical protein L6452_31356 [Arctium lappa]
MFEDQNESIVVVLLSTVVVVCGSLELESCVGYNALTHFAIVFYWLLSKYTEWALGFRGGIYDKDNSGCGHDKDHSLQGESPVEMVLVLCLFAEQMDFLEVPEIQLGIVVVVVTVAAYYLFNKKPKDEIFSEEQIEQIESAAEMLYGLIYVYTSIAINTRLSIFCEIAGEVKKTKNLADARKSTVVGSPVFLLASRTFLAQNLVRRLTTRLVKWIHILLARIEFAGPGWAASNKNNKNNDELCLQECCCYYELEAEDEFGSYWMCSWKMDFLSSIYNKLHSTLDLKEWKLDVVTSHDSGWWQPMQKEEEKRGGGGRVDFVIHCVLCVNNSRRTISKFKAGRVSKLNHSFNRLSFKSSSKPRYSLDSLILVTALNAY